MSSLILWPLQIIWTFAPQEKSAYPMAPRSFSRPLSVYPSYPQMCNSQGSQGFSRLLFPHSCLCPAICFTLPLMQQGELIVGFMLVKGPKLGVEKQVGEIMALSPIKCSKKKEAHSRYSNSLFQRKKFMLLKTGKFTGWWILHTRYKSGFCVQPHQARV